MSSLPAIVVLTPLKNDAWILRRFLSVTSAFADHIIIADQGSTDEGPEICREFPKVTRIDNSSSGYDEDYRQRLLIDTARRLVPLPRLLIALDADEILAADAMSSPGWQTMLEAPPGTSIYFEKPNLFLSPERVERRPLDFPGAFMDDGVTPHRPRQIHSQRLPEGKKKLVIPDVRFLHYALVRPAAQKAKMRMYAAIENILGTKSLYTRRRYYWSRKVLRAMGPVESTPDAWYEGWERQGIDMRSIDDTEPYWQDLATLDLMRAHGSRRLWLDDVWEKDWTALDPTIRTPPRLLTAMIDLVQRCVERLAELRRR